MKRFSDDHASTPSAQDYKLKAYCAKCNAASLPRSNDRGMTDRCERGAVLDLERLIAKGRGDYCAIGRKPRCKVCGGQGQWQLRPPVMKPGISARRLG
jgi:hypothetical protein